MLRSFIFLLVSFFVVNMQVVFATESTQKKYETQTRYIIDTDMGFDDWLAVIYLLEQKNLDVAAITIDCQGETRCPEGAVNAARLTHLVKRDVPIAVGYSKPQSQYSFPGVIRNSATAMAVPGFANIPVDTDEVKLPAAQMIAQTVIDAGKAHQKVVIISIGTAANIADAWRYAVANHQATAFHAGLKMIFKGGGAFGQRDGNHLTNKNIPGNITIPGIIVSKNHDAEWNIYADATGMQTLVHAQLPITFVPNNATDAVNMTQQSYKQMLQKGDVNSARRFCANAMLSIVDMQGGWHNIANNLDFWDTTTTMAAIDPSIVSRQIKHVPMRVITTPGDRYATTWVSPKSPDTVTVDYHVNKNAFYEKLFAQLR